MHDIEAIRMALDIVFSMTMCTRTSKNYIRQLKISVLLLISDFSHQLEPLLLIPMRRIIRPAATLSISDVPKTPTRPPCHDTRVSFRSKPS